MSAYIQFFIRHEDTFLPIGVFSRTNAIYEIFDGIAIWEKIRPIGEPILNDAENIAKDFMRENEKALARVEEEQNLIANFNNSIDDKLEAYNSYRDYITLMKNKIEGLKVAQQYLCFLRDIMESIVCTDFNKQPYLYVGIEVEGKVEELI